MNIPRTSYDVHKDLKKVKKLTSIIEKRISSIDDSDKKKVDKLTHEELQDLNLVLDSVRFVLCKYDDKKEMRSFLEQLVEMLDNLANPLATIDDEIKELAISASEKIDSLKSMNHSISDTFTLEEMPKNNTNESNPCLAQKNCPNNFTKLSSRVYPLDYLEKSAV